MSVDPAPNRTFEEIFLFNPAYCGALAYEFVRAYETAKKKPAPFALIFCALPMVLHPDTRDRLPYSIITKLLTWIENNPDVRVGFSDRAQNLTPYLRDALRYAAMRQVICFASNGNITTGSKRASFTPKVLEETTVDVRETVNAIRKVARWFAASGDTATILAAWGVRV